MAFAFGIISIVIIASFLILWNPSSNENNDEEELIEWTPEWNVNVGDTFEYLIVLKDTNSSPYYTSYDDLEYSELNGTQITVEITSIPELPAAVNTTLLIDSLLEVIKTEIRFSNGSEISPSFTSFMNPVFSLSFLPTGVWDAIEDLLPRTYNDTYNGNPYRLDYFGRTGNLYNIGCYKWAIDSGGVYEGNVTQTTGVPFMVYRQWDSMSDSYPPIFVIASLI